MSIRHSRGLAIAAGVLVVIAVGVVVIVSRDRPSAPTDTTGAEHVSLEEVELTLDEAVLTRIGDRLVAVDGLSEAGGNGRQLRILLAPADDPTAARAYDYPDIGPVADVEIGSLGDGAVVVAQECPMPFDEAAHPELGFGPRGQIAQCGSKEFGVYALDTISGQLQPLATNLTQPDNNTGLHLAASGTDQALLEWRPIGEMMLVDATGETKLVPRPRPDPSLICPLGESFLTLIPRDLGAGGDHSLEDFFSAHKLVDGAWLPIDLPASEVTTSDLGASGCAATGIVFQASRDITLGSGVQLLETTAEGRLAWTSLPLEEVEDGQVVDTLLVGETPAVIVFDRFYDSETDPTHTPWELYVWDGTQWTFVATHTYGADAILGDFEGSIELDGQGEWPDVVAVVKVYR